MSKIIEAVYENGVFRPLEPVLLPDGEHVQVRMPEGLPSQPERLAALEAFEAMGEELTKEQWEAFEEAVQRRPWFPERLPPCPHRLLHAASA
jgi:predicted DNA-binding antitoxin AbrB/MazE fold protein